MITWETVRNSLQKIIDSEDKKLPLSDDAIVHELRSAGIIVARRTVFKLRQSMSIPSFRGRRDRANGNG